MLVRLPRLPSASTGTSARALELRIYTALRANDGALVGAGRPLHKATGKVSKLRLVHDALCTVGIKFVLYRLEYLHHFAQCEALLVNAKIRIENLGSCPHLTDSDLQKESE